MTASTPDSEPSTAAEAQPDTPSLALDVQSSIAFSLAQPGTTRTPQLAGRRIAPGKYERLQVYGYAVTQKWLDQYAVDVGISQHLSERLYHGSENIAAVRAYLRKHLLRDSNAVITVDENGELTYRLHYGSGSNRNELEMQRAYDPERIKRLKELMRITEEPKWYNVIC